MKVLIDVSHPAHVHIIKNVYFFLTRGNHEVVVTASKKQYVYELLAAYEIPFIGLGSYGQSKFSKGIRLLWFYFRMIVICLQFRPDKILGIVSFRGAFVGWFLRIPNYIFTDTEHATEQIALIKPFAHQIWTPINFPYQINKRHFRHNSYHELAYLSKKYFVPDQSVLKQYGLEVGRPLILVRFVAWDATHDHGVKGFTLENKRKIVHEFSKIGQLLLMPEISLTSEFDKYLYKGHPKDIHHIMSFATLVFGESATMASEAAVLGVPAVFIDDYGRCYTDEQQEKYGIVWRFDTSLQGQLMAIEMGHVILNAKSCRRNIHSTINEDKVEMNDEIVKIVFQK